MSADIQSLQRAMNILEYIATHQGAGVSELSRELSLNKSTVFSILKTFTNLRYLYKNEANDEYQLTYRLQSLAKEGQQLGSFTGFAHPYLKKLQKTYNETIHFVSSEQDTVTYIDKLESAKPIRIHTKIGAEMPLHCTAVGKSILAWRSEQQIIEYADRTGLPALTEKSIIDKGNLLEEMKKIRQFGYSIDDEENQQGLYCIGTPVFIQSNKAAYAISISMPKYRKDEIDFNKAISDLKETAKELSKFF